MTFRIPQSADERAPSEYKLDEGFYELKLELTGCHVDPQLFTIRPSGFSYFRCDDSGTVGTIPVVFRKMTRWEVFLDWWYDCRVWLAQNVLRVRAE